MTAGISHSRTLLIGLDASCWEYLDPLLRAGRLPNLSRLISKGSCGSLRSTMPPITPVAWSSLVTGVNPGKHGVFEWIRQRARGYDYTPVTSTDRVGTTVWERLNSAGISVGVINIPLSYPVQSLKGFLLCGFSTPQSARELSHPNDLLTKIEAKFGPYQPDISININESSAQDIYDAKRDHQRRLVEITRWLGKNQQVDILIINLMLIDHVNHTLPTMDFVERAIEDTDDDLEQILLGFAPDNVMVISDHGSRRVEGSFLLGAWLVEKGYIKLAPSSTTQRRKSINFLLHEWLNGRGDLVAKGERIILRQALTYLPDKLSKPLWNQIERDIQLSIMQANTANQIVPKDSLVYMPSGKRANLNLNMVGREPQGKVSEEERLGLIFKLKEALFEITEPNSDERLFKDIYRPEEIYNGPLTSFAPDLIGDYYHSAWSTRMYLPGLIKRPYRYFVTSEKWYGDHSVDGIYVLAGLDFRHIRERKAANLLDIPATLLYLYDVPQPEDYDGSPLLSTFVDSQRPLRFQPGEHRERGKMELSYSSGEENEVTKRLSELGYLD